MRGYRLAEANASRDLLGPFRLLGVVREDVRGLRLLYEPGKAEFPRDGFDGAEYRRRRETPLRGTPTGR